MADIASLADAIESLKIEVQSSGGQQIAFLDNIALDMSGMLDNSNIMVEELRLLREALAPDNAFERAGQTEREREAKVRGDMQAVTPVDGGAIKPAGGGGLLKKLLIGGALAAAALGVISMLSGFLDFDASKIKANVVELLSIQDEFGGAGNFFLEGGTFALTMAGIGAGLAVFGIGTAIAGAADKFIGMDVESIKQNVIGLLSIGPEVEKNGASFIGESAKFLLAMTGLGLGLAVFGIGSAVAGMSDKLMEKFNSDFATSIKNNVLTLLSIGPEIEANGDSFIGESAKFLLAMTGLGLGLAAFGIGSAVAGLGDAIAKFSMGTDWTQTIKDNVINLVSVTDDVSAEKAKEFSNAMGLVSAGLLKFSGGSFGSAFLEAGANILNFLTGGKSPIEQMMEVGDNADKLNKGADALDRIQIALGKLGGLKFSGSKLGITEMAEDLLSAIPAIETAINGGTVGEGWISKGTKIKGLASGDIKFEDAATNIKLLRESLGLTAEVQPAPITPQVNDRTSQMGASNTGANVTIAAPTVAPTQVNNSSSNSTAFAGRNEHRKRDFDDLMFATP